MNKLILKKISKMFNFFKDKKIEFWTPMPNMVIEDIHSPRLPNEELHSLMKKVKPKEEKDIKTCPGIIHYIRNGFIVPAWQDIKITTAGCDQPFNWETGFNKKDFRSQLASTRYDAITNEDDVGWHPKDSFFDYFPRKNTLHNVIKFKTPWFVKLPPGYSALILPVFYNNEERFSVIPGVLDTEMTERLIIQVYWHSLDTTETVDLGTPLAKIIPFKKEKWNMTIREATEEDLNKHEIYRLFSKNSFGKAAWKRAIKIFERI